MNKFTVFFNLIILALLSNLISPLHAAPQPKFNLVPTTPTTLVISSDGSATVQYRVTNNTKITRVLTMVAIPGISQVSGTGLCSNPFVLAQNQSCLLTLLLQGNALPDRITSGPVICKTEGNGNNNPDPFLCSQPSSINSLNITRTASQFASIAVSPSNLALTTNGPPGNLTVTNLSNTVTALNIQATLPSTWTDVTEDASNCLAVAPLGSCQLHFTPGGSAHTTETVPVAGSNTNQVNVTMSVDVPASLSVTGSPLGLIPSGAARSLTITNNSTTSTALNITADFTGTALQGNVTETGNTCAIVLPLGSCTLTFTPGPNPVAQTTFPISGSNTATVTADIAILTIGSLWHGGLVFELNPDSSGKVTSIVDISTSIAWGTNTTTATGAISDTDGPTNTQLIFNAYQLTGTYAARTCLDYTIDSDGNSPCSGSPGTICYSDWYLPAKDELHSLRQQSSNAGGPIPINGGTYWSSTEDAGFPTLAAWVEIFSNASQFSTNKTSSNRLRCISSFTP